MEEDMSNRMPLIGDQAPAFHAKTTQGEINFPDDLYGKWIIFFSNPGDFTPVCTTEFMTFASMMEEFQALNTVLVGLSIDTIFAHIAWLRKIQELSWKDIKHVEVTFPLVEDITMEIAKKYGMIHSVSSSTKTVRAVFIIDPQGIIRAMLYYPASTGRNMEELKRMIIALQKTDSEGVATPANWLPCDDVILPVPGSCGAAKQRVEEALEDQYCLDWFLCFQQSTCRYCNTDNEANPMDYQQTRPARGIRQRPYYPR